MALKSGWGNDNFENMFLNSAENKTSSILFFIQLLLAFILIAIISCNEKTEPRQIEPSFYYWKSILNLTNFEKQKLDSLKVKTIYLKFFDVDWDEVANAPAPVAKMQASRVGLQGGITIIPTVFITNECIQKIDSSQIVKLAGNIYRLILEIRQANGFGSFAEIQIDCDWAAATKEKYFQLLNNIKSQITNLPSVASMKEGTILSCTIRLHQIKYLFKTGIPPVDKGLLMCYNMGNLKDPDTKNSILETAELKKYTGALSNYPLPLDIAFPLFDWKVLFRNNMYKGLIGNLPDTVFKNSFTNKIQNRFGILKDTMLQGYDLRQGDIIRNERSDIKEILSAAGEINKHLKNTPLRVSLYHLDSVILSKYSTHELESIYNSLR